MARAVDPDPYLARIGLGEPPRVGAEGLRVLQHRHLTSVPFENLDILAGRPLSLELEDLAAKIVGARRGGFCYELNGLFAAVLEQLGYRVRRLAAETWNADESRWGPPLDHLVLAVDLEQAWLADVGFGDTFRDPLPLRPGTTGPDVAGRVHQLERQGGRWVLAERASASAVAVPQYRFDETPYRLADFTEMCRYQETESPFFTRRRVVTMATPDGRRTLLDNRLVLSTGRQRTERLVDEREVPGLLADLFGIAMPSVRTISR